MKELEKNVKNEHEKGVFSIEYCCRQFLVSTGVKKMNYCHDYCLLLKIDLEEKKEENRNSPDLIYSFHLDTVN